MSHACIPSKFWDEIMASTVYLINRLPSHKSSIPYITLFKKDPNFSLLRVLGYLCFPYTRPYNNHKLEPRALPCIFLGYALSQKGYRCLHIPTNKIFVSRHVRFNEDQFPFRDCKLNNTTNESVDSLNTTYLLSILQPNLAQHRPTSTRTETEPATTNQTQQTQTITESPSTNISPSHTSLPAPILPPLPPPSHSMTTRNKDKTRKPKIYPNHITFLTTMDAEPTSYSKAALIPEWRQAMALEIDALAKNNIWTLVPAPQGQRVIGCKWVFKLKRRADGTIDRHKARLVAKGFNQVEGIDFFETYSPVVRPATIRVILSLAVSSGWPIR